MRTHRIAVIPGDGVGPEVTRESEKVLAFVGQHDAENRFELDHFPWGTEYYLETGEMMPSNALETLSGYDAILFGAVGSPKVLDSITLRELLLTIRFGFDQYVNLRPVKLLPGVPSPLAGVRPADVDMIFVREGVEGEYAGVGEFRDRGTPEEVALQTAVFSRRGTERVIRYAFELARRGRRSLTSVSKGNALQYSGVLWDEVFDRVADEYPDVETRRLLVDAAAMFMVGEPERFEVVVASNLYADILTDLGAALMGGMGLAPSANLDPSGAHPSMFEPIHGSAPDIAGKGLANPIGQIWSTAMMLEHLRLERWATALTRVIARTVARPEARTPDLGGAATTEQTGDAVTEALESEFDQRGGAIASDSESRSME
jgi:tartrate dehydrogenase/decarboxylase / D-malate dehydrogenase